MATLETIEAALGPPPASGYPADGLDADRDAADALRAARGDADSFLRLYRRYARPAHRYLAARAGDHHLAEELAALAFERAWRSLPAYRPTGSFAGWLFTIVRRVLADHFRRAPAPSAPLADTLAGAPGDEPEQQLLRSERRAMVLRALAELPQAQQELICLRFFAELPYAAIAALAGKSEPAVKMAIYRALESLKGRIDHD